MEFWMKVALDHRDPELGPPALGLSDSALQSRYTTASQIDPNGLFATLANGLDCPVFYIDYRKICCAHNGAANRVLGLEPHQIDGRTLREVVGPASYDCIQDWVERALSGKEVFLRQVHRNSRGRIIVFDAHYLPHFGSDNAVLGFCALLTAPTLEDEAIPPQSAPPSRIERGIDEELVSRARMQSPSARKEILARLTNALQSDRFCLFHQEIVPTTGSSGGIRHSQEVLLRMKTEGERLIHPGAFLGLAREVGFMKEIDQWVIERLLRWLSLQAPTSNSLSACLFHVNLSEESLLDSSLIPFVRQMLTRYSVPADALCFEIAETDLIAHRLESMARAQAFRLLGCRVALDRFKGASGSYSSLLDMAIDFVKIDSSIVANVRTDSQCRTKLRIITKVAHINGVRTVAEQVEDADIIDWLRDMEVDYVQGFGIAMPLSLEGLTTSPSGLGVGTCVNSENVATLAKT